MVQQNQQGDREDKAALVLEQLAGIWAALMPPETWKAKSKAFNLFIDGKTPKDISPRQVLFIKRRTLYGYYQDFKRVRARFNEISKRASQDYLARHDDGGDDDAEGADWLPPADSVLPLELEGNGD